LEQRFNRQPDISEIASELQLSESSVQETISIANNHVSLDAPLKDADGSTLLDMMQYNEPSSPDESLLINSLQNEIEKVLDTLCEREKDILKLYFGIGSDIPFTLDDIAQRFNITRERVRQIKTKAIDRLKNLPELKSLVSFGE
jgi:RNA polymerase primary sigma factor